MTAYIIASAVHDPTMLASCWCLCRGAVRPRRPGRAGDRQLSGSDTGATSRISGSPSGDFGNRGMVQADRASTP